MNVVGQVRKGAYFDSVTLMRVGKEIAGLLRASLDAAVVMGTKSNKAILKSSGLLPPAFDDASDTDLLVAVKADTETAAGTALAAVDGLLKRRDEPRRRGWRIDPANLGGALEVLPGANLALISIGRPLRRRGSDASA